MPHPFCRPQDLLIDMFGGPDHVAEMTGRKSRMVREGGCFRFRPRATDDTPLDLVRNWHLHMAAGQPSAAWSCSSPRTAAYCLLQCGAGRQQGHGFYSVSGCASTMRLTVRHVHQCR